MTNESKESRELAAVIFTKDITDEILKDMVDRTVRLFLWTLSTKYKLEDAELLKFYDLMRETIDQHGKGHPTEEELEKFMEEKIFEKMAKEINRKKMEQNKIGDCENCPIACACVYELTGVCLNPKGEKEDKENK